MVFILSLIILVGIEVNTSLSGTKLADDKLLEISNEIIKDETTVQ